MAEPESVVELHLPDAYGSRVQGVTVWIGPTRTAELIARSLRQTLVPPHARSADDPLSLVRSPPIIFCRDVSGLLPYNVRRDAANIARLLDPANDPPPSPPDDWRRAGITKAAAVEMGNNLAAFQAMCEAERYAASLKTWTPIGIYRADRWYLVTFAYSSRLRPNGEFNPQLLELAKADDDGLRNRLFRDAIDAARVIGPDVVRLVEETEAKLAALCKAVSDRSETALGLKCDAMELIGRLEAYWFVDRGLPAPATSDAATTTSTEANEQGSAGEQSQRATLDSPDASGYVESPIDPTAYTDASMLEWGSIREDKRLKWLQDYQHNQVRWTRPNSSKGGKNMRRLHVHNADFTRRMKQLETLPDEDEIARRAAEIRAKR